MSNAVIVKQHSDYTRNALGTHTLADEHGFPISSFAGLWYFTKDENGDPYNTGAAVSGPFYDETGNGNHAEIILSSTPEKQAWGLLVEDVDGLWLDTGILFPASGTAICALSSSVDSSVGHHQSWMRPNLSVPATKSDSVSQWEAPHPSMTTTDPSATPGGKPYSNTHGIIDFDSSILADLRLTIPSWRSAASGNNVVAWRWNNASGRIELFTMDGYLTYQHASLIGYWSTWTALSTLFGIIPFAAARPCTGNLYAAALATTVLGDAPIRAGMEAIARMKYFTGGGLNISGYVPPTI